MDNPTILEIKPKTEQPKQPKENKKVIAPKGKGKAKKPPLPSFQALGTLHGTLVKRDNGFYLDLGNDQSIRIDRFEQKLANRLLFKGLPEGETSWNVWPVPNGDGLITKVVAISYGDTHGRESGEFAVAGQVVKADDDGLVIAIKPNFKKGLKPSKFRQFTLRVNGAKGQEGQYRRFQCWLVDGRLQVARKS